MFAVESPFLNEDPQVLLARQTGWQRQAVTVESGLNREWSLAAHVRPPVTVRASPIQSVIMARVPTIEAGTLLVPDLAAHVSLLDGNNHLIGHLGTGPSDYTGRRFRTRKYVPTASPCDRMGRASTRKATSSWRSGSKWAAPRSSSESASA